MSPSLPRTLVVAATALLLPLAAGAQSAARQHFPVPGHGSLQLEIPKDWRAASRSLDKPASVALRIRPASGDAFLVQVTAVWLEPAKLADKAPAQLKEDVERGGQGPLRQAVEKELRLEELRGAQVHGYYYSLTDRAPAPGEYKYLTQGTLIAGELLTIFTLLQRESAPAQREQALQMFAGATYAKATPTAGSFSFDMPEPRLRITVPDLPQMAMAVHPNAPAQPHARFMGTDNAGHALSVLLPTGDPGMTPLECARWISGSLASRYGLERKAIATHQTNDATYVMLFPLRIGPLTQFKAYLLSAHGGTHCVEVHISKTVTSTSPDVVAADLASWYQGFRGATIAPY